MNSLDKKLLKAVVKRVHPDLFSELDAEREQNSRSLQALNSYLADITKQGSSKAVVLCFWARERKNGKLVELKAELPAWGSIGPLLYVFGLITEDELIEGKGSCSGKSAKNVLSWLESSVAKAADAAEEHEALRAKIRTLRVGLEEEFALAAVKLSKEYSTSVREQQRHIEALKTLRDCLESLESDKLRGLQIELHYAEAHATQEDESTNFDSRVEQENYVGEEGTLHVMADPETMKAALNNLDLNQARLLTRVAGFWQRRAKDMTRALRAILGIKKIWCDSYNEHANQLFVEWAALLLNKRPLPAAHTHNFSLLLHTDTSAPFIEFTPASSMLQVRCDTDPAELLRYLDTTATSHAVTAAEEKNKEEEQILEDLKRELGLKHAIRVGASTEQDSVVDAAKRLLQNKAYFKAAGIKLEGASLAFDNCYEVWESGFISIPHDFKLEDLKPKLQLLLTASSTKSDREPMPYSNGTSNGSVTAAENEAAAGSSPDQSDALQQAEPHSNGVSLEEVSLNGHVAALTEPAEGVVKGAQEDLGQDRNGEGNTAENGVDHDAQNSDLRALRESVDRATARLNKVQTYYVHRRPILVPPNFQIATSSWRRPPPRAQAARSHLSHGCRSHARRRWSTSMVQKVFHGIKQQHIVRVSIPISS